jgi:hypothetical protein
MTVGDLIKELEKFPEDTERVCQVVANDGSAWTMKYSVEKIPDSDWAAQLRVAHDQLHSLRVL